MQITVNGAPQRFENSLCVADLVQKLGMSGKKIAVERNGEIVPKSVHARTSLRDGDKVEIVVAVGGG
jgi:sulfur carrier protein